MRKINVHQVDSFTDAIFSGNPAGVVSNAESLSVAEMIAIAREMNLSETAFVLPASEETADIRLRYFTPKGSEIDFCGHATIGALHTLSRLQMNGLGEKGTTSINIQTNAGVLAMSVQSADDKQPRISFRAPDVELERYHLQDEAFAQKFGMPPDSIRSDGQVFIDRALNYLYIPTSTLRQLGSLQFDATSIRSRFADENIVAFCLYSNETVSDKADLHARVTCPFIGIDEDPFTGSTQAGLLHAAKRNGLLDSNQATIVTEQGHFIGRPGFATINHDVTNNSVIVTAQAQHVFSTIMELQ